MRGSIAALGAALLLLWARPTPADIQSAGRFGFGFDSNVFQRTTDGKGSAVMSFGLTSRGAIRPRPDLRAVLEHEAGIRRYSAETDFTDGAGDVIVNRLGLTLGWRAAWLRTRLFGAAKFKSVTRVPGEESYVLGEGGIRVTTRDARGVRLDGTARWSATDSRDANLPETRIGDLDVSLVYSPARRLVGEVGYGYRRVNYDREALVPARDGGFSATEDMQVDRQHGVQVSLEAYRGGLYRLGYGYTHNASNSFGYGFTAHSVRAQATIPLPGRLDATLLGIRQFRHYDEDFPPRRDAGAETDDYEQGLLVAQLSRGLSDKVSGSLRYTFSRNGTQSLTDAYRKQVIAFFLEFGVASGSPFLVYQPH